MSLDEWTQGWLDEYQDAKREGDAAVSHALLTI
jgi:hypothetical protein